MSNASAGVAAVTANKNNNEPNGTLAASRSSHSRVQYFVRLTSADYIDTEEQLVKREKERKRKLAADTDGRAAKKTGGKKPPPSTSKASK